MGKVIKEEKINKKKIFIVFITLFLIYFPIKLLLDFLMKSDVTFVENIIQSLVFSLVLSLVSIFSWKPSNKKIEKLIKKELGKGEKIEIETRAGRLINRIIFPGKIYLTNQRLIYIGFEYFQFEKIKSIKREDIIDIQPVKMYDLIDNGIQIEDRTGKKHKFNFDNRDQVLAALQMEMNVAI